jgi:hypothetical protein
MHGNPESASLKNAPRTAVHADAPHALARRGDAQTVEDGL